jgi:hypothetical protein
VRDDCSLTESHIFQVAQKFASSPEADEKKLFENDKLVRVTFAHKDVRSPYQWQSEKDLEKAEKEACTLIKTRPAVSTIFVSPNPILNMPLYEFSRQCSTTAPAM